MQRNWIVPTEEFLRIPPAFQGRKSWQILNAIPGRWTFIAVRKVNVRRQGIVAACFCELVAAGEHNLVDRLVVARIDVETLNVPAAQSARPEETLLGTEMDILT